MKSTVTDIAEEISMFLKWCEANNIYLIKADPGATGDIADPTTVVAGYVGYRDSINPLGPYKRRRP
jgi:hypothetical protein